MKRAAMRISVETFSRMSSELETARDQLRVAREALEKAWLELESAAHLHKCAACRRAAGETGASLSLLPKEQR